MYAPRTPEVTWGQKVLRVQQMATDEMLRDDDNGRTEERLRDYLYRRMDDEVSKHLRNGEAWVVQYGVVAKEDERTRRYTSGYWQPHTLLTLDVILFPVAVQRGQQTYRMFEYNPDTAVQWPKATASDIWVRGFVYDAVLDSLADKRKYVGLTVDGKVRFFERTSSGWKRLW